MAVRRDVKNVTKGPVTMDLNLAKTMLASMMSEESDEREEEQCQNCDEESEKAYVMDQLLSFVKGYQGKGGPKGGVKGYGGGKSGKFDGNCHHCGIYERRITDCWKKDQEVAKGKAKGKGDPFQAFGGKGKGYGGKGGVKGFGGKGLGSKGFGGKGGGKGSAYGFETYDWSGDVGQGAWTNNGAGPGAWALNMSKMKLETPPGLKIPERNRWKAFESEEKEDDEVEERKRDMAEMEGKSFPKMGNYSKGQRREEAKPKFRPIRKESMKPLSMFLKEEQPKELATITQDQGGWQRITGVMDSGASESVAHPSMSPQYEITPSAGSLAGQKYISASGDVIPNLGEQVLDVVMDDGNATKIKYQTCDVSRALNSISEICDAGGAEGQYVLFSKWGGTILNPATGRRVPFEREDGIYTLGMWVRPKASGFTRQA